MRVSTKYPILQPGAIVTSRDLETYLHTPRDGTSICWEMVYGVSTLLDAVSRTRVAEFLEMGVDVGFKRGEFRVEPTKSYINVVIRIRDWMRRRTPYHVSYEYVLVQGRNVGVMFTVSLRMETMDADELADLVLRLGEVTEEDHVPQPLADQIIHFLDEYGPERPKNIAILLDANISAVNKACWRLAQRNLLVNTKGRYSLPPTRRLRPPQHSDDPAPTVPKTVASRFHLVRGKPFCEFWAPFVEREIARATELYGADWRSELWMPIPGPIQWVPQRYVPATNFDRILDGASATLYAYNIASSLANTLPGRIKYEELPFVVEMTEVDTTFEKLPVEYQNDEYLYQGKLALGVARRRSVRHGR